MGAEQSSTRGAAAANDAPQKTDYYELLGLDFKATDDEYVNLSSPPPPLPRRLFLCVCLSRAYNLTMTSLSTTPPLSTESRKPTGKRPSSFTQTETMATSTELPRNSPRSRPPTKSYPIPRSAPGTTPTVMPSCAATTPPTAMEEPLPLPLIATSVL